MIIGSFFSPAANPGSYLWLVQDRPVQPQGECQGIDDYKYGLSGGKMPGYSTGDFKKNGRDGVVSRYLSRYVHYALGTADNGTGDTSCQAWTRGSTHLERGNNFISMLKNLPSGMPTTHTIDMIEGVSHQNDQMFNSTQLIKAKAFQRRLHERTVANLERSFR
ncbi:hypothetical protein D9758_005567 [Tetrapyrgos nigripes]|uniref:Uncharacterized protein n=1 Tax=Tetrapyrgos nigripes TaxID=182062 RepID=A0A8H5LPF2_9AGAR|nr:hypothetical protein D9758_005567 [Tetrapyrgos nigripes]